jgi:hypothetical protein
MCLPEPIEPFMPLSLKLSVAELRKDKILTIEMTQCKTFFHCENLQQIEHSVEEILYKSLLGICRTKSIIFGLEKKRKKQLKHVLFYELFILWQNGMGREGSANDFAFLPMPKHIAASGL